MDETTFNSMMNQEENNELHDPTGLFILLKNIQNQACSSNYLCIEIGTIYGDFGSLKPIQKKVPTVEKEDIQLIIKPTILVNNTISKPPPKMPFTMSPPKPKPEPKNNITTPKIFEDDDCEGDFFSSLGKNMRFSEKRHNDEDITNEEKIQRKFYRKVQYGENILVKDIFSQGVNLLVLRRDHTYSKGILLFH